MTKDLSTRHLESTASAILYIMMLVARGFSANLKKDSDGLEPAHMRILMRLAEGSCSLSELAIYCGVKPPTVSRSVNVLVNAGFVARTVPADNRRMTKLELTATGREKLELAWQQAEAHVGRMLESLTRQERKQIDAALKMLIGALTA